MRDTHCGCGRKVVVKINGKYKKTKSDHDLCFRCYAAYTNRERAIRMAEERQNAKEEASHQNG